MTTDTALRDLLAPGGVFTSTMPTAFDLARELLAARTALRGVLAAHRTPTCRNPCVPCNALRAARACLPEHST